MTEFLEVIVKPFTEQLASFKISYINDEHLKLASFQMEHPVCSLAICEGQLKFSIPNNHQS